MNEKLLQFIWQHQIFNAIALTTVDLSKLVILHPGIWNHDQGPDFKVARIKLNGQLWIGNIELHIRTSDWIAHQHDRDPNYKNIILHVVWQHDIPDHPLPVLELESRVPALLLNRYKAWSFNNAFVSCSESSNGLNDQVVYPFISWLSSRRLQHKCQAIYKSVDALSGDWEEAFWRQLARCFGHKVNADSFERMAENIPYKILIRHHPNLTQLEALIFGQAGLLHSGWKDDYPQHLHKEFLFLRKKYALKKNVFPLYFLRMRPVNFPTVRLAQLASLIHHHPDLFKQIKDLKDIREIKVLLKVSTSIYWNTHFRFDEESVLQLKGIGDGLMEKLLVNIILPFLKAYQLRQGKVESVELLDKWTLNLRSEYNSIISGYAQMGIVSRNMHDSQGLLELKTAYCDQLRCLDCAIGRFLLKQKPV